MKETMAMVAAANAANASMGRGHADRHGMQRPFQRQDG